jgi:hypothetical protein
MVLVTVAVEAPVLPAVALKPSTTTTPPPVPVFTVWSLRSVMLVRLALVTAPVVAVLFASRSSALARKIRQFAVVVVIAGHDTEVLAGVFVPATGVASNGVVG